MASVAVSAARARRVEHEKRDNARFEWFIKDVQNNIKLTMLQRVKLATEVVKDRVIRNISVAVVKEAGLTGATIVTKRSSPGEFPRADTTQLMKSVFAGTTVSKKHIDGFIGTPLDYGIILETQMDRSFLVRTLNQNRSVITKILTGPIK